MKTYLFSLLLILFAHTAGSQTPSVLKDFDLNTKTFDPLTYDKNKGLGDEYEFYLDQNIKVYQSPYSRGGIEEIITRRGDPYSIRRIYYYPSGKISFIGKKFYNFYIGLDKSYDENGKLDKKYNNDYLYNFSVDDLVNKMHQEYGIDVLDLSFGQKVSRTYVSPKNNNKPTYSVTQEYLKKDSLSWEGGLLDCRKYIIDGSTGQTTKIEERVFMGSEFVSVGEYDKFRVYTYRFYERNSIGKVKKVIETRQQGSYEPYHTFMNVLEENVIYDSTAKKGKDQNSHPENSLSKSRDTPVKRKLTKLSKL